MSFGGQTVTFVTVTETGQPGFLGVKEKQRSEVSVAGCHFRPFKTAEVVTETDIATEVWKCTAPPEAAVLAAKSTGEVKHNGLTFQIDGQIQPKYDLSGQIEHVTIFCKRQAS